MNTTLTTMTDKVCDMIRGMVFYAIRSGDNQGASAGEITARIQRALAADGERYHIGAVEHALYDLQRHGQAVQLGGYWYALAPVRSFPARAQAHNRAA